jgi:hypothetical protein
MVDLSTVIWSVGGAAAATSTVAFIARRIFEERLTRSIQHEYDRKLETLRDQLRGETEKQIEQVRQKNQMEIEVLRGTTLREIESLKSSLEVSRSAARLLIERRMRAYEEYFSSLHDLSDASTAWAALFAPSMSPFENANPIAIQEARGNFSKTLNAFEATWSKSTPFIPDKVGTAINGVFQSYGKMLNALENRDSDEYRKLDGHRINRELMVEQLVRSDLASIMQTGSLQEV